MTDVQRLRRQAHDTPTREHWLALGNALYGSEVLKEMSEALAAYHEAEKIEIAAAQDRPMLYGADGQPVESMRPKGLPEMEWARCRILMQRVRAVCARGLNERLPGLHRPMDADRKHRPRGVSAEGWDGLGTATDLEKVPRMTEAPSPEQSQSPRYSPLGPLAPVPGDFDPEGDPLC